MANKKIEHHHTVDDNPYMEDDPRQCICGVRMCDATTRHYGCNLEYGHSGKHVNTFGNVRWKNGTK